VEVGIETKNLEAVSAHRLKVAGPAKLRSVAAFSSSAWLVCHDEKPSQLSPAKRKAHPKK